MSVLYPSGHGMQLAFDVPPRVGEYVERGHSVHARDAYPDANEPAGHVTHDVEPDADEKVPGGQAAHDESEDAPSVAENFPLEQGVQPRSVCPGAGLYVPAAHALQFRADVAPRLFPKNPGLQGVHADADARPSAADQVPAGHLTQPPP